MFDILNTKSGLGFTQKHTRNIIEEIVFRNCTYLLPSKIISSIMFQICFWANHSQDRLFKISNIIQNFDYKYILGHVLLCTQNCHLNSNSTHCAGGRVGIFSPDFGRIRRKTCSIKRPCITTCPTTPPDFFRPSYGPGNDDYSTHGYIEADTVFPEGRGWEFPTNDRLGAEEDTRTCCNLSTGGMVQG